MTQRAANQREFFDALAQFRQGDVRRHGTYYRDRERWLTKLIPADASVIEIGCGTGPALRNLPQEKKTGIDISPKMIELARAFDPTTVYGVADIQDLSEGEAHDYVLLLDTINFLGDVQASLTNIRKHFCHERTRLVITHYNFLWQPLFLLAEAVGLKTKFPEQNWLSRRDISNLLDVTGFEVVETGERVLCPVSIPLLVQLCNRFLVTLPLLRRLALVKTCIARPRTTARKEYSVTVLSAVRNERGNIRRIADEMPVMGTSTELLFIEGHSTDGTWEEMESVAREERAVRVRALKQPGRGKGDALHFGASQATGDILLVYDGDFTVHPKEMHMLYDALAVGSAELVNGSRLVYPLQKGAMRLINLLGNKVFSTMFTWLFRQQIVDALSPVKGLFRRDYRRMTERSDPFGDFDLFFGAAAQQLKIREVPIHYLQRTYGTTKMRPFKHAWMLLRLFLKGAGRLRWS